jgi:RNA polymerase sigma-70 factor (ECF subfamily)
MGFEILYKQYSRALMGVIIKIVKTDPPAKDVLQDSFIKIWKNIDSYDAKKGTFFTWILNITRNTAIDTMRTKAAKNSSFTYDTTSDIVHNATHTHTNENFDLKIHAQTLEHKYKQVLDMLYFEGYSQSEVAEILNIPLGTVKTRVKYAVDHLRKIYKK